MGRSVSYLNNAETIIYFTADWINEEENHDIANMNWEDFEGNLKADIKGKLKSYYDADEWDNREAIWGKRK